MKICLYDWNHGGHHPAFLRLFAEALSPVADVVVAASDPTLTELGELPGTAVGLGDPRPRPFASDDEGNLVQVHHKADLAREDLARFDSVVAAERPDHVALMYADPVLRWLLGRGSSGLPTSLVLHHPRFHYRRRFRSKLPRTERLRARYQQANTARWRRRPEARSIFTVDPVVADIWNLKAPRLAPAHSLRELPVPGAPARPPDSERSGAMIFGFIDERKGIDRVAAAVASGADGLELLIAGRGAPEYEAELGRHLDAMRAGGVAVERIGAIPQQDALLRMGRSRCVLLAFGLHPAASRVLLEAATMGTPVVAPDWGLIGHLVRTHGLGVTADPGDPDAIREAILRFTQDPGSAAPFRDAQRAYVEHCSWPAFRSTIREGFGVDRS